MPRKKYSKINVPMNKTTDLEGRLVIDSRGVQSTFDPDGTLTFNGNNGILTWNSGDITHLNFTSDDFSIMYDAESNLLTLTAGDKNIYYQLDTLKELIQEKGYTIEEMEKILEESESSDSHEVAEILEKEEKNNEETPSDSGHAK